MEGLKLSREDMRDAFIRRLHRHATARADIVLLSNDYGAPSLDAFRDELPDRFYNMAIAEQNMISVAAGMALSGLRVFVYSIASFLTLRCLEQVKIDICAMGLPVTLLGVGPCYAYSQDGPTHHATEDIPVMRSLAGLSIFSPADSEAAGRLADVALGLPGPAYIRLDRGRPPILPANDNETGPGFTIHGHGADVCLVATGLMTHRALETAERLAERGVFARVLELCRLKPLDGGDLARAVSGARLVLSLEEHSLHGGLGSIVAEAMAEHGADARLVRRAVTDEALYAYGMRDTLHQQRRLDVASLEMDILARLQPS